MTVLTPVAYCIEMDLPGAMEVAARAAGVDVVEP